MTQYVVTNFVSNFLGPNLGVKAVSYELKIAQVNIWTESNTGARFVFFRRQTGSTLSGGTSLSIFQTRAGSPAATALARAGSVSFSGTVELLAATYVSEGSFGSLGHLDSGGQGTLRPTLDLIIEPGTVFTVQNIEAGRMNVAVYFEELRL